MTLDAAAISTANITTQAGAIDFSGAVSYTDDAAVSIKSDVGNTGAGANITFASTLGGDGRSDD